MQRLIGKTLKSVDGLEKDSGRVTFKTECGLTFYMHHDQD